MRSSGRECRITLGKDARSQWVREDCQEWSNPTPSQILDCDGREDARDDYVLAQEVFDEGNLYQ